MQVLRIMSLVIDGVHFGFLAGQRSANKGYLDLFFPLETQGNAGAFISECGELIVLSA